MPDTLQGADILNVGGDLVGRNAVTRLLRAAGCRVWDATTGEEALRLASEHAIDLVLLDLNLPDMSGYAVAARLKEAPATAGIPVLCLSATERAPESIVRGLEGGADGYLTEPVAPEALLATVRALLRMRQARQEAEARARELEEARAQLQGAHEALEVTAEELTAASGAPQEGLRRRAERLEESEARYRALIKASSEVLYHMSPDWSEMCQLQSKSFLANTDQPSRNWLQEYIPPDEQERVLAAIGEAVRTGSVFELEHRVKRADGTVGWTFSRAVPVRDAAGEIVEWFGAAADVTGRVQAEETLRAKEAQLELVLARTPFMLTRCSRDLSYQYVSRAYAEMIGRTPEQVEGRPILEVMGEQGFETIRPHVEAVLQGQSVEYEAEVHFASVGSRQLRVNYVPDRDEHGEVIGWIASILDLTERKQAEAALRRSEALLEAVVESTDHWLGYLDTELHFVWVNRALAQAARRRPEAIVGRTLAGIFPVSEMVRGAIARTLASGQSVWLHTTPWRLRVGTQERQAHIALSLVPVRDAAGAVTGLVFSAHDLTPEVRQRQQLDEQARFLAAFLDSAPVPMAYLDAETRFVRANHAYAGLAGRPAEELVGRTHFEVWHLQDRVNALREALETGQPVSRGEVPVTYPGQPERAEGFVDYTVFPVKEATGARGLVLVVQDVTERVRRREELLEAERARAELAERLNAEIAHRVKNNLAMVSGLLQLQAAQASPEAAEMLQDTVSRIHTFANIHDQMARGRGDTIDLLEVVGGLAESTCGVFCAEGAANISISGTPVPCAARAATNISVVANELITNALKHGGPGEDGIQHVSVHVAEEPEGLVLEVWNSGDPVPEGFDPAAQEGLGLRLVSDLVAGQYGGRFTMGRKEGGTLARVMLDRGRVCGEAA